MYQEKCLNTLCQRFMYLYIRSVRVISLALDQPSHQGFPLPITGMQHSYTYLPGSSSDTISSTPMITCPSCTFFPLIRFAILCCAPFTPAENPTGKGAIPDAEECDCTTTCSNTWRKPSFIASMASASVLVTAKLIDWSLPSVDQELRIEVHYIYIQLC